VKHWSRRGAVAWLLWPASLAFRVVVFLRRLGYLVRLLPSARAGIPVVAIGNLTVGGSGKVTVFTKNDWRDSGAIHLDAWWDQAELVILGAQPTAQPTAPAQPQVQPPAHAVSPLVGQPQGQSAHLHTPV